MWYARTLLLYLHPPKGEMIRFMKASKVPSRFCFPSELRHSHLDKVIVKGGSIRASEEKNNDSWCRYRLSSFPFLLHVLALTRFSYPLSQTLFCEQFFGKWLCTFMQLQRTLFAKRVQRSFPVKEFNNRIVRLFEHRRNFRGASKGWHWFSTSRMVLWYCGSFDDSHLSSLQDRVTSPSRYFC